MTEEEESLVDRRLCEELWLGRIRIEFSLDISEVASRHPPRPCQVLCHRYSYLPVVSDKIVLFYKAHILDLGQPIWFEESTNKIPLKRSDFPHDLHLKSASLPCDILLYWTELKFVATYLSVFCMTQQLLAPVRHKSYESLYDSRGFQKIRLAVTFDLTCALHFYIDFSLLLF